MIAYRVEHKTVGCGPYNVPIDASEVLSDDEYYDIVDAVSICRRNCSGEFHPSPYEIPEWNPLVHIGTYIFGFESLEQLKEWFDKQTRKALSEVGYVIKTYEMDKCMKGQSQIAFNKFAAKPLTTLSLVG